VAHHRTRIVVLSLADHFPRNRIRAAIRYAL
jgi:hypothetical protein